MANELRVRADGVAGALDASLTSTGTTMSSPALADLPVIGATNHAIITISTRNSDGRVTAKEIVKVTAHTAAATTATIVRGQSGTTGVAWAIGDKWVHGPIAEDFAAPPGLWLPRHHGFVAWTDDPAEINWWATPAKAALYLTKIHVPETISVANVHLYVAVAGSGLTADQNFAGIYSSAGSRLAGSSDQSSAWASAGHKAASIGSAIEIVGGPDVFVWAGLVTNGTGGSPQFVARGYSGEIFSNINLAAAAYRSAFNPGGGVTSLPASITPASNTSSGFHAWAALS